MDTATVLRNGNGRAARWARTATSRAGRQADGGMARSPWSRGQNAYLPDAALFALGCNGCAAPLDRLSPSLALKIARLARNSRLGDDGGSTLLGKSIPPGPRQAKARMHGTKSPGCLWGETRFQSAELPSGFTSRPRSSPSGASAARTPRSSCSTLCSAGRCSGG